MKGVLRMLLLAGIFFGNLALAGDVPDEFPSLEWLKIAVDNPAISPEACLDALKSSLLPEEGLDLLLRLKKLQIITRENLKKAEAAKRAGNQTIYILRGTTALYSHLARLKLQQDAAEEALRREKEKERKREEESFRHTPPAA